MDFGTGQAQTEALATFSATVWALEIVSLTHGTSSFQNKSHMEKTEVMLH